MAGATKGSVDGVNGRTRKGSPKTGWDTFNSNSYISGLLQSFGYRVPEISVPAPGWRKPVPSFLFTTSFASDAALRGFGGSTFETDI